MENQHTSKTTTIANNGPYDLPPTRVMGSCCRTYRSVERQQLGGTGEEMHARQSVILLRTQ